MKAKEKQQQQEDSGHRARQIVAARQRISFIYKQRLREDEREREPF